MAEKEKEKEKEKVEVMSAVYKVNLHCHQCGLEIKKPLTRTQGIESVEVDIEKNEIKVKGCSSLDVLKIHKKIEKLSKKKVELISPKLTLKPKDKEDHTHQKPKQQTKPPLISHTITAKVHLHCTKCEQDIKKHLLKHNGIYSVKTDMKAQALTVETTMESEKFKSYLKNKLQKNVEITTVIINKKKEEKKEVETKIIKKDSKSTELVKKDDAKTTSSSETETTTMTTTTKIVEVRDEVKVVEVVNKAKDNNAPYFIHYVYAPQLFSDENPHACRLM